MYPRIVPEKVKLEKNQKVVKLSLLQKEEQRIKKEQRDKGILNEKSLSEMQAMGGPPDDCYGQKIDGRPVSPSIMNGDNYKLRRDRDDLFKRVSKTLNVDYDPKQLKPFLKQLAKKDVANKIKPMGLANQSSLSPDLRIRYRFMLGPVINNDPKMIKVMGADDQLDKEDMAGLNRSRAAFFQTDCDNL